MTPDAARVEQVAARLAGLTHAGQDYSGLRVVVAGIGISGFAAADALLEHGADVLVVDEKSDSDAEERATLLTSLGAQVRLGPGSTAAALLSQPWSTPGAPARTGVDLVLASPGWRPDTPLLAAAADAHIPIWGEVELAWRMRPVPGTGPGPNGEPAPWLVLTGTNGKTTTVKMLTAMLTAAGLRAVAAGNVGTPLIEALRHPARYQVIAVELSSFQLHWTYSMVPQASAVLNVAPDHIDWHGSLQAYAADKGRIYTNTERACVYNVQDPRTQALVEEAEVIEGARAIGFTLGVPGLSMLGVVDDVLADRAFVTDRRNTAAELATLEDVRRASGGTAAPHSIANALAAAALARAHGVPSGAVRDGLRAFTPDPHRLAHVAQHGGVQWVDDSKATNPHAADAALRAFESVIWIAGGLAKGATFDDLIAEHGKRLRAAILIGADADVIAAALARHAPDVPVVRVLGSQTDSVNNDPGQLMRNVVSRAAELAHPGDVVLLAPACASMDQFISYGHRGDLFAQAVLAHLAAQEG